MKKDTLHIRDVNFAHSTSSSWYHTPKHFDWVRNQDDLTDKIVITKLTDVHLYPNKKVYGWIIEPPEINNSEYDFAINNIDLFEKIFTYNKDLLMRSEKFVFIPIGGCWIDREEMKIYEKTKLVCTINSNKKVTELHKFRHEMVSSLKSVDLYGSGYQYINKKIDVLKDYMFCIVIENQQIDFLFTEKIIDCFVTGTIPIYKGCKSIGDFFNTDGIITFETLEDLEDILNNLSYELYLSKSDSIKENFDLSTQYLVADDLIYENLKNE